MPTLHQTRIVLEEGCMPMRAHPKNRAWTLLGCVASAPAWAQQQPDPPDAPLKVEIIGTTPLPGLGTPLRDVPANVQVYSGRELGKQRQGNLSEFLENNPTSIAVNAAQGNPYQADISFRGFTASPLVGPDGDVYLGVFGERPKMVTLE